MMRNLFYNNLSKLKAVYNSLSDAYIAPKFNEKLKYWKVMFSAVHVSI